ncbi:MAG: DUF3787 domain-containing protein [Clostridia bacterium]|nr:DUF3787 domain-containing protein [Clostridia bacterium]MDR3645668.1 DUF3787 domain-containing protein [Clostridia bacterium]
MPKKHFRLVKNEPNLHDKGKNVFLTQAISQKDDTLRVTDVSLPDDDNVEEARDWVNFNQK